MVLHADRESLRARRVKHVTVFDALKKEKKMRLRITKDLEIAFDGHNVQKLEKGKSYDIPERFAPNLLNKGFAEQDKAIDKAPETKTKTTKTSARKRARK